MKTQNSKSKRQKCFIVAITGASGAIYAKRLLEILCKKNYKIHLTLTENSVKVIEKELDKHLDLQNGKEVLNFFCPSKSKNIVYHHFKKLDAPIASGSYKTDGMVIVPCSMGTLGRIANGISSNLIERAADVILKERRKLILVPRETPFSSIHLENMLKLSNTGAIILPASPGFYQKPKTIDDQVDFIINRILSHLE